MELNLYNTIQYKFFIHLGLQCNQHEVHNFTYIFLLLQQQLSGELVLEEKKKKKIGNVGFSSFLRRTIFH